MALAPCESWTFDRTCCDLPDDVDEGLLERWQAVSTNILWVGGGRRHGLCSVTVRPCLRNCDGGYGLPAPYRGPDGEWRNFATCGCHGDCSCLELCEIVLDGPADSVTEVIVDGEVLDPETYRLDLVGAEWRLLRVDGDCWPACQIIQATCGDPGSFCVTYLKGVALDELALAAHAELTCELVKACTNCQCRIPKNVATLVRQGVSITFDTTLPWIHSLPMVAIWLNAVNPKRLPQASTVWSPDLPEARITEASDVS